MLAAEALEADCFLSILTAAIRGPGPLEGFAESPLHGRRGTDSGFPAVWHLLLSWTRELSIAQICSIVQVCSMVFRGGEAGKAEF